MERGRERNPDRSYKTEMKINMHINSNFKIKFVVYFSSPSSKCIREIKLPFFFKVHIYIFFPISLYYEAQKKPCIN